MKSIGFKCLSFLSVLMFSTIAIADGAKLNATVTIGTSFLSPNTTTLTGYYDVRSDGTSGGEYIRIHKNLSSVTFNMSNIITISAEDSNGTRFSCSVFKAFDPATFSTIDQLSVLTHGVGIRVVRNNTNGRCTDSLNIYLDSRYGQP